MIHVIGPRDSVPAGATRIDTTSRGINWSKQLSPFLLGPAKLYGVFRTAKNAENAWQYSKVYAHHIGEDGNPTNEYFHWAQDGWDQTRAVRYPMGKGAIPVYSWWDGEKLSYIEARKKIYIPIYAELVQKTDAFNKLQEMMLTQDLALWDFDGYNHRDLGLTYQQVIDNPDRKMGHAFVIAMLLEKFLPCDLSTLKSTSITS